MATLSIFVDESGDFGVSTEGHYIVALVFHEQSRILQEHLDGLSRLLSQTTIGDHAVHSSAAIRGESSYRNYSVNDRKAPVDRLFAFTRRAPIYFETVTVERRQNVERLALEAAIGRALGLFLQEYTAYFRQFDEVVVYYDNGQNELTRLLNFAMNAYFLKVDFKKVKPADYRLFQVADLCCTLEFLRAKDRLNSLSKSDLYFFESAQKLRKNYLHKMESKRLPAFSLVD